MSDRQVPPPSPRRVCRAIVAITVAACCWAARAHGVAAPLPPAAAALLAARFPGLHVLSQATGALHAVDARDVAAVLGRGERGVRVVAVLWGDGRAGFSLANASGDIDAGCVACDVSVRIRERALEVGTSDPGRDVATLRTFRFAYRGTRGNVLRLVDLKTEQIAVDADDRAVDCVVSTDLLTGDKVDAIERVVHGAKKRSEAHSHVPLRQPVLFDQFAFDWHGDAPETRSAFARELERR